MSKKDSVSWKMYKAHKSSCMWETQSYYLDICIQYILYRGDGCTVHNGYCCRLGWVPQDIVATILNCQLLIACFN